jgi:glyoxylase-like metal-dependent hydrolase (beta-lactamase superfamily II)
VVTGIDQQSAWVRGCLPPVERLAGGVWSVPIPMTGHSLRYVLCYVLEGATGPVIIDPGWPDEAGWAALVAGLATAGWATSDVHGVLVTHAHSDHLGLAARLREESGCWIGMHRLDAQLLGAFGDGSAATHRNSTFLDMAGVPRDERPPLYSDPDRLRQLGAASPDRLVEDGDSGLVPGRSLRARWTPGHTPGHLCFGDADAGRLFSGDHLLPRITSHVGSYDVEGPDVLGTYLAALSDVAGAVPGAEVLPGHEYRFQGTADRVAALQAHHAERLEEVADVVRSLGEPSVWEVARGVHWSRSWEQTVGARRRLALAETLAHLRHLATTRRLTVIPGPPARFRAGRP